MINDGIVIGFDHGTGGCKLTAINQAGEVIKESYTSYNSYHEHPKWVEQNPKEWIQAAKEGLKAVLSNMSDSQRNSIKAFSFSAPHHVAVLLDKNNHVIRNAIMWNDQRSKAESIDLKMRYGEYIYNVTKNTPSPTWTLPQLVWLKDNQPDSYSKINKMVFMKDYVRYYFSGVLSTDYIDAEGTMFYDLNQRKWDEKLLEILNLNINSMPEVGSPLEVVGKIREEIALEFSIPNDIAIVMGTADTAAELYGCGVTENGDGLIKLATAGNFALLTSEIFQSENVTTYDSLIKNSYFQNSATNSAASSFRWFKETFYIKEEELLGASEIYNFINDEANEIGPGAEGLIFHPYLNGERSPYWNPDLKASFFGITVRHNRKHFARAVLEGIVFSIKDASLEFEPTIVNNIRIIGGGSKSKLWCQIVADIFNKEIIVPKVSDASFGSALVAGTAIGWYKDLKDAVNKTQKIKERISPIKENVSMYKQLFGIYKLHQQSNEKIAQLLSELN